MKHIQEVVVGDYVLCVNSNMEVSINDVIEISYCEDSEQFVIKLDNGIYISNTIYMEYAVCEMDNSIYVF